MQVTTLNGTAITPRITRHEQLVWEHLQKNAPSKFAAIKRRLRIAPKPEDTLRNALADYGSISTEYLHAKEIVRAQIRGQLPFETSEKELDEALSGLVYIVENEN